MKLSAVLLAGGKSQRMGCDKATLLFGGTSLWKRQLELLRNLQPQRIFISARTDPPWRPADVKFIADEPPSRGPLSGIAAALANISTEHVLALAIDMPFITEDYLRDLWARVDVHCGAVPMIQTRAEPLAAIYPHTASVEFANALSGDDFSLQPIVRKLITSGQLRAIEVSPQHRGLFRSLNEPSDLNRS
jgi:molybdopterin-guanine dinucleotide biosynthesis protein A